MKRVLVTGAGGFIGRRCLSRLSARGFEVRAVSSKTRDLLEPAAAQALIEEHRPTHLLHLAWIAQPGVFWTSRQNLEWLVASIALVEAFYTAGGTRAVGAGSCAEYAQTDSPCSEELTPLAPDTLYGEAKAAMYFALRAAARGRGSWAWPRFFFPYGPGEPPGRFIPSVIHGLLQRAPVECTHGNQVRDFIYIDDVAEACAALVAGEASGAYNIGSGQGSSLRDVAALIVAQLGHGELLRFGARPVPQYDPARVVADIAKIRREQGWAPRVTLAEGIRKTIAARDAQGVT